MKSRAFFGNFRLVLLCVILGQNAVLGNENKPGVVVVGENTASIAVETCTSYKAVTKSRELSQEWVIEDLADRLNTSHGKPEDLQPLALVNAYGGIWSFALIASHGDEITIKYNATISRLNPNPPNSIMGQAVLQGLKFTKEFHCIDPYPLESGWTNGMCYNFLSKKNVEKLAQMDSVTVSIKLSLLNANISELEAAEGNCDGLRQSTKDSTAAQNSSSALIPAIITELDEQYAKIWKHRISLEWSIPIFSPYFGSKTDLWSYRKLAKLRLSKETPLENYWDIDIELEQLRETKVMRTTVISMGQSRNVRLLNITRAGVAFSSSDQNQLKVVPLNKTPHSSWFFWLSSAVTDEELAKLVNRVVVLLEYEVIYGLKQKRSEATTENRICVDSRR